MKPAPRHRRGAAARPAAAAARRADHRPRPRRHARHARARAPARRATGMTVLLSSHLMGEVEELCDRVAIVTRGRVDLRGRARRADRQHRRPLRAAHHRRRPRGRDRPPRRRRSATSTAAARGLTFAGRRARRRRADARARRRPGIGLAALVPRTATLEELFFRMTEGDAGASDRARRRVDGGAPHDRRRRTAAPRPPPRRRHRLRLGAAQARAPRSAPTSGSAARCSSR